MVYPVEYSSFVELLRVVERVSDPGIRIPNWPFRIEKRHIDVCQFGRTLSHSFGAVVQSLVDVHEDSQAVVCVLEPKPDCYRECYGSFPGFAISRGEIEGSYWDHLAYEPGGDPAGAVAYTADVFVIAGSSGAWAIWAERSWDLAMILTRYSDGPWKAKGVPFVPAREALVNFTEPDFKTPLSDLDRNMFIQNLRRFTSVEEDA